MQQNNIKWRNASPWQWALQNICTGSLSCYHWTFNSKPEQASHLSWQLEGGNLSVTTSSSTESPAFAMTGIHFQLDTLQEITIHGTYSFRKLLSSSPATRSQYICWSVIFTKALNKRTETSVDNQFFLILINVKLTIRQFFLSWLLEAYLLLGWKQVEYKTVLFHD